MISRTTRPSPAHLSHLEKSRITNNNYIEFKEEKKEEDTQRDNMIHVPDQLDQTKVGICNNTNLYGTLLRAIFLLTNTTALVDC
jgi:hypothetical protein